MRIFKLTQGDARKILDTLASETRHRTPERRRLADVEHGSIAWLITLFIIWNIWAVLASGSCIKSTFTAIGGRTTKD